MPIPDSVPKTAAGYLKYLGDQISRADKHWTHYGWAVSHAYATAYKRQLDILKRVKDDIEARLEFDHDLVSFGLSLLTVGVAGGVAGIIARKMFDKSTKSGEIMIDVLKQSLQRAQKSADDADIEAISPKAKVAGDAFAPAGVTPEEYTTALQEGISYYSSLLSDIQDAVAYDPSPKNVTFGGATVTLRSSGLALTADDARRLTEMVINSTYVKDLPPTELKGEDLVPKASLGLWIGWAYGRDVPYWRRAKTEYWANNPVYDEEFDWEPVRQTLILLGVPASQITENGTEYLWGNRTRPKTGLDMWSFLNWVASPAASKTLLSGLPTDDFGFESVKKQMALMQLTPVGWVRRPDPGPSAPIVVPDALKPKR